MIAQSGSQCPGTSTSFAFSGSRFVSLTAYGPAVEVSSRRCSVHCLTEELSTVPNIGELPFVQKILLKLRRQGLWNVLHGLSLEVLNSMVLFKILRGVYVDRADPAYLACQDSHKPMFLSTNALREFAKDPVTEMSERFVDDALRSGDQCYAICDGATLAAYGWYSTRPTPAGSPDLLLHFAAGYVYMYKGFTDSRYRGQRLHAIGMTRALEHYLSKGFGGIVSYVESTNFDSLKSCFRMGYKVFGSVLLIRIFGRYFTFSTPGCKAFGFWVEHAVLRAPPGLARGKS